MTAHFDRKTFTFSLDLEEGLALSYQKRLERRFARFSNDIVAHMQGKELYSLKSFSEVQERFGDIWKTRISHTEPEEQLAPQFLVKQPKIKKFRKLTFKDLVNEFKSERGPESEHFKEMLKIFIMKNSYDLTLFENKNDIEWRREC